MNASISDHSLVRKLSLKNFRITAQRRVLLDIIQRAETHLDAATLLKLARRHDTGINRATVYRTIELLKKLGLVDELDLMHLDGGKHYYEARDDVDHVHLACLECGRIEEFTSPYFEKLKDNISRQSGFEISITRLELGGRCKQCRTAAAPMQRK